MNMWYCYMDESWDLWRYWLPGNSKNFFIVFFLTKNKRISNQAVKKTIKWMKNKKITRKWWVFHANHETHESIEKFLTFAQWKEYIIATYYINKENMQWISKDQHLLYNNMVIKLLKHCIDKNILYKWEKLEFYAARKETNKHLNKLFENQIKDELNGYLDIEVYLRYPHQETWLQLVDSIAYSLFYKYETNNLKFYDLIKWNI